MLTSTPTAAWTGVEIGLQALLCCFLLNSLVEGARPQGHEIQAAHQHRLLLQKTSSWQAKRLPAHATTTASAQDIVPVVPQFSDDRRIQRPQSLTPMDEAKECLQRFHTPVRNRLAGVFGTHTFRATSRKGQKWYDGQVVPLSRPRSLAACLIYKSGSSRWRLLLMHAAGHRIAGGIRRPSDGWLNQPFEGSIMDASEARMLISDPDRPRFAFVRNPYNRWLSGYLHFMLRSPQAQPHHLRMVKLSPEDFGGRRLTNSTEDFHEFTAKVYDRYKALRGQELSFCSAINQHFAPQTCLCGLSQGLEYDYLLKLEEQGAWYPGFIKLAGLEHFVRGGWAPDVGGSSVDDAGREQDDDCFWRMPGKTCNETDAQISRQCVTESSRPAHQGSDGGAGAPLAMSIGSVLVRGVAGLTHSTGADGLAEAFYRGSPETVRMVTEMFRRDLDRFGYPAMTVTS